MLLPQLGQLTSSGEEMCPHPLQRYPSLSATLLGMSSGFTRVPSEPFSSPSSLLTSAASMTLRKGLSGFSGLWDTRISCVALGRFMEMARAIIDLPVPGGPTSSRFLRWMAAILARLMASSCPRTRSRGSAGISICPVCLSFSTSSQTFTVTFFGDGMIVHFQSRSVLVQMVISAGSLAILPLFFPTRVLIPFPDEMSRMFCEMTPSNTMVVMFSAEESFR